MKEPVDLAGRSRYERRLLGMSHSDIAKQDGVTSSAVMVSVRKYRKRAELPRANPAESPLLSARLLASVLGVGETAVRVWARRGLITTVPRGKQQRFILDDVRMSLAALGWSGGPLWDPVTPRGEMVLARRAELETDMRACSACRRAYPRSCYPPSAGKSGGWLCPDCRLPSKKASDARRRGVVGVAVERISHLLVARRDGWRCAICGGAVTRETWSLDHVVPLSKGGSHTYANVVLAHLICNVKRGAGRFTVKASLALPPGGKGTSDGGTPCG